MALDTISIARLEITKIYIAAFNRAPDAAGLSNWMNQYTAGLMTYKQISEDFSNQAEYKAKYPSAMTNDEYITKIYSNVFGRTPDAGGLENWVSQLDNSSVTGYTRGNIMKAMLEAAGATGNTDGIRLANQAEFAVQAVIVDGVSDDIATAQLANITSDHATVDTATAAVAGYVGGAAGETFTLTTGIDGLSTMTGTAGNDTYTAVVSDTATVATLTALDSIDGGAGVDTLNISDIAGTAAGIDLSIATIKNIETMNIQSINNVADNATTGVLDTTAIAGLTTLNVTKAKDVYVKAATTTDVNVSGAISGGTNNLIQIDGGKNVSVTDGESEMDITIGATTKNAGTITVTDTKQGTGEVKIEGGTDVTVTTTGSVKTAGTDADITIGNAATVAQQASGAVIVNATGAAYDAAAVAATVMGNISVTGGKTISVTQKATSDNSKAAADNNATATADMTQGNITIVAGATTTDVTVKQDADVAAKDAANSTGGVTETVSVKFIKADAGQTVILGGLTLKATVNMTATEVAAAFANLAANAAIPSDAAATAADGDTQGAAASTKGIFTGSLLNWATGAATGDTVVFTSTETLAAVSAPLAGTGTAAATPTVITTGKAHDATPTGGVMGVNAGVVDITATASVTTVTVDGYDAAGNAIKDATTNTALATINLSNGGDMTVDSAATTLALNLTNVSGTVDVKANTTTINATVTGTTTATIDSASATTLKVSGAGNVAGTTAVGGLTAATSINTADLTGTATFTLATGATTTYTGGAGVDSVTVTDASSVTKAINLGNGNDTLKLSGAVTAAGITAVLDGGEGTDTLSLTTTLAAVGALSANTAFSSKITGFERLLINSSEGNTTVDLEKLGFTNYVTTSGSTGTLTLNNLANNGTVVMTADATIGTTVTIKDAATGEADHLNVVLSKGGSLAAGTITAADTETLKITATDTVTTNGIATHTATLAAAAATTLTVDGNAGLTLAFALANVTDLLATINATDMTAALSVDLTLHNGVAVTVNAGSGADVLKASVGTNAHADILKGGAGNDTLVAGTNGAKLTGGDGNDLFILTAADATSGTKNALTATEITDFKAGDLLQLSFYNNNANGDGSAVVNAFDTTFNVADGAVGGVISFAKLTAVMNPTESTLNDYITAAITQATVGQAVWFTKGTDSYVVIDSGTDSATTFVDTEDMIIQLTGVSLTNASFNAEFATVSL